MKNLFKNYLSISSIIISVLIIGCKKFEEINIDEKYSCSVDKKTCFANNKDTVLLTFIILKEKLDKKDTAIFKNSTIKLSTNLGKFENNETILSETINYYQRVFKIVSSDSGTATISILINEQFKKTVTIYFKKPAMQISTNVLAEGISLDFDGAIDNDKSTSVNFTGKVYSLKGIVTEIAEVTMTAYQYPGNTIEVGSFTTVLTDQEGKFNGKFYLQDSIPTDYINVSASYTDSLNNTVTTLKKVRLIN